MDMLLAQYAQGNRNKSVFRANKLHGFESLPPLAALTPGGLEKESQFPPLAPSLQRMWTGNSWPWFSRCSVEGGNKGKGHDEWAGRLTSFIHARWVPPLPSQRSKNVRLAIKQCWLQATDSSSNRMQQHLLRECCFCKNKHLCWPIYQARLAACQPGFRPGILRQEDDWVFRANTNRQQNSLELS